MQIQEVPVESIRPYPNNPRILRNAAEKIAESIRAFGWRQPIVVDEDGVIVIGHGRYAAAKLMKLKTVPVHVATGLTPDQIRALRVADNKTGELSDWDDQKLADELAEIMAGLGSVAVTGFSQAEFDELEMQARAALSQIDLPGDAPAAGDESGEAFGLGDDDPPGDDDAGGDGSDDDDDQRRELVPFSLLMDPDARQVVYDAITQAKQSHGLEQTSDALLVICRRYLDA